MPHFFPFFVIFLVALVFSIAFKKLHFPWVIALIVGGMVIGPFGMGILEVDQTISFFGEIGLIFLMFMAGLEVNLSTLQEKKKEIFSFSALNGLIPFFVAVLLGVVFGYDVPTIILLGIIFMSSSVAVIIPAMKEAGLLRSEFGRIIVASITLEDMASLLLLSVFLQVVNPIFTIPIPIFYLLLFILIVILKWMLPRLRWILLPHSPGKKDIFEKEFQFIFVALLGMVIFFEIIGLHGIIAGFLAGLLLSDSIKSKALKSKISAISYGIFIPVFFVVVGMEMNIGVFAEARELILFTCLLVVSSMISKFSSGYLGGKLNGFTPSQSQFAGVSTIPQLSTGLAAAFVGLEAGILGRDILTSVIVLSVLTTLFGPFLINYFIKNNKLIKTENEERHSEKD